MNWLSRVRNSLSVFAKKRETPDDLWVKCPRCHSLDTREITRFGSTSCKAHYQCRACLEPFDYFKVL